jgi:hypothetical protein
MALVLGRGSSWIRWSLCSAWLTVACSSEEFSARPPSAGTGGDVSRAGTSSGDAGDEPQGGDGNSAGSAVSGTNSGGSAAGGRGGQPPDPDGGVGGTEPTAGSPAGGSGAEPAGGAGARAGEGGSAGDGAGGVFPGGLGGLGGLGALGGSGGTGGEDVPAEPFPSTGLLDDFEGDDLEQSWTGATSAYYTDYGTLTCDGVACPAMFWHERLGVAQEAFVTIVSFAEESPEINLVLKAQDEDDTQCDMIEIMYEPPEQLLLIEACWEGNWRSFGTFDVNIEPGDQLGGRVRLDGFIEVFKNGERVGLADGNAYPFIEFDGLIGVNGIVADEGTPNAWDDFGGGYLDDG